MKQEQKQIVLEALNLLKELVDADRCRNIGANLSIERSRELTTRLREIHRTIVVVKACPADMSISLVRAISEAEEQPKDVTRQMQKQILVQLTR